MERWRVIALLGRLRSRSRSTIRRNWRWALMALRRLPALRTRLVGGWVLRKMRRNRRLLPRLGLRSTVMRLLRLISRFSIRRRCQYSGVLPLGALDGLPPALEDMRLGYILLVLVVRMSAVPIAV